MIIDMVENSAQDSTDDKSYVNQKKITYSKGLHSIEKKTVQYIEQQEDAKPTTLMTQETGIIL